MSGNTNLTTRLGSRPVTAELSELEASCNEFLADVVKLDGPQRTERLQQLQVRCS